MIGQFLRRHRLRRLAKQLAPPTQPSVQDLLSDKRETALAELIEFCVSDPQVGVAMEQFQIGPSDLRSFYHKLRAAGAGQWAGRHYVPASAIAHGSSIRFLCENSDRMDWRVIAVLLIEYFERDETGPVPTDLRGPADPSDPLAAVWDLRQQGKQDGE